MGKMILWVIYFFKKVHQCATIASALPNNTFTSTKSSQNKEITNLSVKGIGCLEQIVEF